MVSLRMILCFAAGKLETTTKAYDLSLGQYPATTTTHHDALTIVLHKKWSRGDVGTIIINNHLTFIFINHCCWYNHHSNNVTVTIYFCLPFGNLLPSMTVFAGARGCQICVLKYVQSRYLVGWFKHVLSSLAHIFWMAYYLRPAMCVASFPVHGFPMLWGKPPEPQVTWLGFGVVRETKKKRLRTSRR